MLQGTRWRAVGLGLPVGIGTLLLIGIPTVVIPNPLFTRMTPTRPQDYVFLGITALLAGAIAATYALPATCSLYEGRLTTGGLLSFLAVGCPACNKIVVLLLGTSGALRYFAPLQPVLALVALTLLVLTLMLRLRAVHLLPGGSDAGRSYSRANVP